MLVDIIEMFPEDIVGKVINLHLHFTDNDKIIITKHSIIYILTQYAYSVSTSPIYLSDVWKIHQIHSKVLCGQVDLSSMNMQKQ